MIEALNRCYSGFYGLRQTPTDVRTQRKRGASLIFTSEVFGVTRNRPISSAHAIAQAFANLFQVVTII